MSVRDLNLSFLGFYTLDKRGLTRIGTWVEQNQTLALRIRPLEPYNLTPYERLLFDILEKEPPIIQGTSFCVPESVKGRVVNVEIFLPKCSMGLKYSFNKRRFAYLNNPFSQQKSCINPIAFLPKTKKKIPRGFCFYSKEQKNEKWRAKFKWMTTDRIILYQKIISPFNSIQLKKNTSK